MIARLDAPLAGYPHTATIRCADAVIRECGAFGRMSGSVGCDSIMPMGKSANREKGRTVNGDFNWIANFIWGIADDVLRDLYVRGKYRDVPNS